MNGCSHMGWELWCYNITLRVYLGCDMCNTHVTSVTHWWHLVTPGDIWWHKVSNHSLALAEMWVTSHCHCENHSRKGSECLFMWRHGVEFGWVPRGVRGCLYIASHTSTFSHRNSGVPGWVPSWGWVRVFWPIPYVYVFFSSFYHFSAF